MQFLTAKTVQSPWAIAVACRESLQSAWHKLQQASKGKGAEEEHKPLARLSSSEGCCKWCSDHTSSHASCGAAGFLGFTSSKQLLVSAKPRVWIHNLNMLLYTYWCSRDGYSQMGEISFCRLAWKVKEEEAVGVETARGELGDHLRKSILTHKKGGEENQRELLIKKKVGGGEGDSPASSSGPYM